jgi:hypothetical protein
MNILIEYVNEILKPTITDIQKLKKILRSVATAIQHNSSLSLQEIRNGGSFEKGTMLKHNPEADIVLIFNRHNKRNKSWENIMNTVKRTVTNAFPEANIEHSGKISLKLSLPNGPDKNVDIDIVPSLPANSPIQMSNLKNSKVYQGTTTIWHVEYVKKVKNLFPSYCETVMLIKDWRDEFHIPLKSFYLELLAASALYEREIENQNLQSFFKACLREIQGFTDGTPVLPVEWEYFGEDEMDLNGKYIIIDPANPKDNLASSLKNEDIDYIRSSVSQTLSLLNDDRLQEIFDPENKLNFNWE